GNVRQATAVGADTVAAVDGVALGFQANAKFGGVAVGTGTKAEDNAVALGINAEAFGSSIAIGAGSVALESDSDGFGYLTRSGVVDSVVSIGDSTTKRRIVNLADGSADYDAV